MVYQIEDCQQIESLMLELSMVDSSYVYLDLEINTDKKIYRIGLVSPNSAEEFSKNITQAYKQLNSLKKSKLAICGHNFRRFDYPRLTKEQPQLSHWTIIDTLELSVLTFPLQPSHKLSKDYKQSEYSSNNPLEDARATRLLLHQQLEALVKKPPQVQQLFTWLLTCGDEDADTAYKQLFCDVLGWKIQQPTIEALPHMMLTGMNDSYLQHLWKQPQSYSFDTRLCVAALLAWNYECNITESVQVYSNWLRHLPTFPDVLDGLCPLKEDKLIYSYLKEFGDEENPIEEFRVPQKQAIQAILNRENPLVIMPTGGGKSLCYQLPALMLHKEHKALSVVISPLQALMADQVADLEKQELYFATFINGNLTALERQQRLEELRAGSKGLLYISPEQLRSMSIRALLEQRLPAMWVIDEAHCISQWGHDFRPDYRYIPKFIKELYKERPLAMPLLALMTATATTGVVEDIKTLFAEHELNISHTLGGFLSRDNLTFEVLSTNGDKDQVLLRKVEESIESGGSVLIYTTTRKNSEKLAELLNQSNIYAKHYHGKLSKEQKQEVLEEFKSGELKVVTATCAFGMGINRKDVRAVIHHCMSANLEGYVQEAGRAGRDDKPSTCTLLFDPKDTDTIFYLQSLNQLSEQELTDIFIATRNVRDHIFGNASEDWFWVTPNEIFFESSLNEEFGQEPEQRDTKIKVALHYLENFKMVKRAENSSTFIQFELQHSTFSESMKQFEKYSRMKNLSRYEAEKFERLIQAMHVAKAYWKERNESFALDRLSDEAGISLHDLTSRIRELQKAEVCSVEIPLMLTITKNARGDARSNYERLRQLEEKVVNVLCDEMLKNENEIQINLGALAARLDPNNSQKIRASSITSIIEGWVSQKWVKLRTIFRDTVRLWDIKVSDHLPQHQLLTDTILEILYQALEGKKGAKLALQYELGKLANEVTQKTQLVVDNKELESALFWLHQRKILRVSDGLNLFQQFLKVKVTKDVDYRTAAWEYPTQVKPYYDEQTKRTHIMVQYGKLSSPQERQQFVKDYFTQEPQAFHRKYQLPPQHIITQPVLPEDSASILDPLNSSQKEIVQASSPTMAVIAGPGSGKTRTIVHRIAYLVKVKRVEPQRILLLAYNRNAIRELRLRLQKLIGSQASRIRIYTFHGLALAILGRTLGEYTKTQSKDFFDKLLVEACDLIEKGEEFEEVSENPDEDIQARRIQLLGRLEYIFVDEYQDVSESEYRMIKLIAGLNESKEKTSDKKKQKKKIPSVQINLCVIGDDDQNIYSFRGADTKYILQFEEEYKAKRLLLVENYRSTESIIQVANKLISHNTQRCKKTLDEQVKIDKHRQGHIGLPVEAYTFGSANSQAVWIQQRILSWIQQGTAPHEIALLARQWNSLNPIRLLLEAVEIPTYSLKTDGIKLVRNLVTCQLIDNLKSQGHKIFLPEESIFSYFENFFIQLRHSLQEPTVKTLLKIAGDIDQERGFGSEDQALPISAVDVLTAIFEFNESSEVMLDEKAVLITSCHGAKGLEFNKVILLGDDFKTSLSEIESERRLFYVAMTRAKEELVLCSTKCSVFVTETGIIPKSLNIATTSLPQKMYYADLSPGDVNLGHRFTQNNQHVITRLQEGELLQFRVNKFNNGWEIYTSQGQLIGALSRAANEKLSKEGISPGRFQFQPGDVSVRSIYRHLKTDPVTNEVIEDWFVVIPQIRVCW
jgi:ATP-dependent DNA helicase RecQ